MTLMTQDYSIFNKKDVNRILKEPAVLKLLRSIREKNLLHLEPIIVNKNLEVMDGQHRLECARRLGVPIYYKIDEKMEDDDIITLNSSKKIWDKEDYLHFYVQKGFVEYIKLKNLLDSCGMSVSSVLAILGKPRDYKKTDKKDPFKSGTFMFPTATDQFRIVEVYEQTQAVVDYIRPKVEGRSDYVGSVRFRRALYLFFGIGAVKFPIFMQKLGQRIDLIRPGARLIDYLNIFKQIYNYMNREKITIDEDLVL